MSSHPHRTCSTTTLGGVSRKRWVREGGAATSPPPPPSTPTPAPGIGRPEPGGSNRLLAGYLAYEFLTNGTLFGQKWDPARAEATPPAGPTDPNSSCSKKAAKPRAAASPAQARPHAYADVARLLKTRGAHVSGIVNPSELARWLQI